MPDILIVGYGNSLRSDDAIGLHAAREVEQHFRDDPQVEVIVIPQLTPELADDIARASFVIFIDACAEGDPGTIHCTPVAKQNGMPANTHGATPWSLLSLANELYGADVKAMCLSMTGWSFELSDCLSCGAQSRVPELLLVTVKMIAAHRSSQADGDR